MNDLLCVHVKIITGKRKFIPWLAAALEVANRI